MAKSHRGLYPQVYAWENLLLAFRKARRGKRAKPDVCRFEFNVEEELLGLQENLMGRPYAPGEYHHFRIHDPKERVISAAPFRDRVLHHALCNIIEPLLDRNSIHDTYAVPGDLLDTWLSGLRNGDSDGMEVVLSVEVA